MRFDAVVIGGGYSGTQKTVELLKEGKKVAVVCKGYSLYGFTPAQFQLLGGTLLMDTVVEGRIDGGKAIAVFTEKLHEVALEASEFYLATGKFFAGGLVSDMEKVYEPLFGIDVEYDTDQSKWFTPKFFEPQPFMSFGAKTTPEGCALKAGNPIVNLFPIGEIKAK